MTIVFNDSLTFHSVFHLICGFKFAHMLPFLKNVRQDPRMHGYLRLEYQEIQIASTLTISHLKNNLIEILDSLKSDGILDKKLTYVQFKLSSRKR